jgi:hypothetical protein
MSVIYPDRVLDRAARLGMWRNGGAGASVVRPVEILKEQAEWQLVRCNAGAEVLE